MWRLLRRHRAHQQSESVTVSHPHGVQAVGGPLRGEIIPFQADGSAAEHIGYRSRDANGEYIGTAPHGFYDLAHDGQGNRLYLWRDADSEAHPGT